MSTTVGIPQALLYYKYYPLWHDFLRGLGLDIVVSQPTNKRILNKGVEAADNEICLPVKAFYGHALSLKDQVDLLFIPRIVSVEGGAYTCPKFLGLPDLIKSLPDMPEVLGPTFNSRLGGKRVARDVYDFAKRFTRHPGRIWRAWQAGVGAQQRFHEKLEKGLTPAEILAGASLHEATGTLRIGIAGHPYNVHDSYVSMNLIKRLRELGAKVITSDMLSHKTIEEEAGKLPKKLFWTYEKEIVGSAFHWLHTGAVDGVVYMLSFACGPDSLIQVLLEHEAKKPGAPALMSLVIDEHSAEAGLVTRVEAFVDMLSWRTR